jgi:hypothetical protein
MGNCARCDVDWRYPLKRQALHQRGAQTSLQRLASPKQLTLSEEDMRPRLQSIISLFLATALAAAGLACAKRHHYYRVYDPYYTDYHVWNDDEVVFYRQWTTETHRDASREFRKIPPEEQKEYWTWRHNHGDPNRDHDRDKDHH